MDARRVGESGHVIGRCSTIVVMAALLAALSVTAVIVTLRSVVYDINTSVKVSILRPEGEVVRVLSLSVCVSEINQEVVDAFALSLEKDYIQSDRFRLICVRCEFKSSYGSRNVYHDRRLIPLPRFIDIRQVAPLTKV